MRNVTSLRSCDLIDSYRGGNMTRIYVTPRLFVPKPTGSYCDYYVYWASYRAAAAPEACVVTWVERWL
jgi:hypothetical protein